MIILVGISAGILIHLTTGQPDNESMAGDVADSMLAFSPTVFWVLLLPPIIFNSAYNIHCALFFRYMTPIVLFACLGTAICTVVVASIMYALAPLIGVQPTFLELMAFGALISATDPVSTLAVFSSKKVDPHLFYLVFGESVVNDAVGLVLFEALAHLVEVESASYSAGQEFLLFLFDFSAGFFGSLVLGTVFGLSVALFFKHIDFRHTPMLELSIYATIMYAPFVVAELCHVSGIVTCLFTGIAARRYAEPNVSPKSASNADTIFRLTAQLTETLIFLELGMSVVEVIGYDGAFNMMFILLALVACLIGRACNIYPIAFLYNLSVRDESTDQSNKVVPEDSKEGYFLEEEATEKVLINDIKIPMNFTHMLWYSGLRGAVSYALVRSFPDTANKNIFVVTTMMIVLVTTFFLGGSTEAALKYLSIPVEIEEDKYMASLRKKRLLSACLGRAERRVRGWVLRTDEGLLGEDFLDQEIDGYADHVEMTEGDHLGIVGSPPKKQTVYDFGQ